MKQLIIGLDLSFSCTGITFNYMENFESKIIKFNRVVLDREKTKKQFIPKQFKNINDTVYKMPKNLDVTDICFDTDDINNQKQLSSTLKAMMANKVICEICLKAIKRYEPDEIIVSMENYILPTFGGKTSLDKVSGLITLQGYLRKFFIEIKLINDIRLNIFTETPSSLKLFFTGDGNAEKEFMVGTFINVFNDNKLIPDISVKDTSQINDVVDSFALMVNAYSKTYNIKKTLKQNKQEILQL